jgi:hypothetical protein
MTDKKSTQLYKNLRVKDAIISPNQMAVEWLSNFSYPQLNFTKILYASFDIEKK